MKINKIIYIQLLLSSVLMSCSGVLDKDPLTTPSSTNYWNTEVEASKALIACYAKLKEPIYSGGPNQSGNSLYWEALSDNALNTSNWEGFDVIMRGDFDPSTTAGVVTDTWQIAFQGIAACNYFLANVDRVSALSEETNKKMKGEALFLRAYFYNDLVQLFGDVPLNLTPETLDGDFQQRPRTEKAIVVEQILQDLDIAIANLPQVAYIDGRIVKGSAIGLKTRVLLNNKRYQEAAETAWSLIGDASNPFGLHTNYSGIFFGEQSNNKEIMFSVLFASPTDYHSLDQVIGGRMSVFPTAELRDAYEENDPRRKMTIFEERDNWAYNPNGFKQQGSTAEGQIPFNTMAFKKYVDTTVNNASGATLSDQHFIKIRYADVLLMYAEAMFESGQGADARALKALNDVRSRPGVNLLPLSTLSRDAIRRERRVELAFEGLRYNDLLRWGIAHEIIPQITYDKQGNKRRFKAYLFPIPLAEMDRMSGLWKQNEGY
jgi:hypothetical protein